jgi:hypothetical protein|tara:strand:+ start:386 stop:556 length:171 start_codon:yes stop_codon:yes gene_type:complete
MTRQATARLAWKTPYKKANEVYQRNYNIIFNKQKQNSKEEPLRNSEINEKFNRKFH